MQTSRWEHHIKRGQLQAQPLSSTAEYPATDLQLVIDGEGSLQSVSPVNIGPSRLMQLELRYQLLMLGETVDSIQSGRHLQGRQTVSCTAAATFMQGIKVRQG